VETRLKTKDYCEKIKLFVTQLAHYSVILGMPWLKKHDPKIGFASHTFTFDSEYCRKHYNTPARLIKIKILHDVPTKARSHNLPFKSSELRHLNIAKVLFKACTMYSRRNCQLFTVIIKNIDRYLQNASPPKPRDLLPEELKDYADVFSPKEAEKLPPHRNYDHNIRLQEGKTPSFGPLYPMFRNELIALKKWLEKNLRKGFIRSSSSPAVSPVLFVKKADEGLRFCVDYRGLNNISVKTRYSLPLIKIFLNNLKEMKYFTKIDIVFAFNNIRIKKEQKYLIAFRIRFSLYKFLVMPFELTEASAIFQRFMNNILREYLNVFCIAYLNDILIYNCTRKKHLSYIRKMLEFLKQAGLYAKIQKCEFFKNETIFLGVIIGRNEIRMNPKKIETIQNWQTPSCLINVQAFIGFNNFY
jgi:hypothetical protein